MRTTNLYILVLATIAAIAGLLFGFDTGIISGALQFVSSTFHIVTPDITAKVVTTLPQYTLLGFFSVNGTTLQEIMVSAVPGGALLGAIASSYISKMFGRRGGIIMTAILFFLGTSIAATAHDYNVFVVGRLLMGFAVGLSATIAPMYLSEVAPPTIRGAVIFLYQMGITVGILFAFIINYIFQAEGSWRLMFAVGLVPSVVLGIGMLLLPESPRWLVLKGETEVAERILAKLRAKDEVKSEIAAIKESAKHASGNLKLLFSRRLRPLVLITFGLFVFQQFTGINTIMYYAPTLFKVAGFFSTASQILASIAVGTVNVLSTIIGIWLVDRLGRRQLLVIGLIGIVACLGLMGASYHELFGSYDKWIDLGAALTFIFFFAISISGIAYIMMSELFPLNVRSAGMAFASCANWGFNMLVSATFLTLAGALGFGNTYYLYALLSAAGLVFVLFLVPETKNRPLEHIEQNLYAGVKMRNLGREVEGK